MLTEYILGFFIAFAFCFAFLSFLVPFLKKKKAGQEILCYVVEHSCKQGTPTMGGIAFVLSAIGASLIVCKTNSRILSILLISFFAYAVVGFLDDFIKIKSKQNLGLRAYQKIIAQLIIAIVIAIFVSQNNLIGGELVLPFSNGKTFSIGNWIIPLVVVVFLACSNGVNLTDGLDGLATTTTIVYLIGLSVLLILRKNYFDDIGNVFMSQEISLMLTSNFCLMGALIAFLLFNCFPAKVFMGDVGSLALGAYVACVSIFSKMSLYIPILGIVYVVSCSSVILQVAYFKISKGKRIFLMAPFHHHLQKKEMSESRVCVLYSTLTLFAFLILLCGEML